MKKFVCITNGLFLLFYMYINFSISQLKLRGTFINGKMENFDKKSKPSIITEDNYLNKWIMLDMTYIYRQV